MRKSVGLCLVLLLAVAVDAAVGAEAKTTTLPFTLKPYGYVKLDASYDTQRTAAGDLMFYVLPKVDGKKDNEFNMTARESRLGLALSGPDAPGIKTTGKFEVDFYGSGGGHNTANLRMRLAYLDLAFDNGLSLLAGQDWETFITVIPRIVNFSYLADAGALGLRRPQVRVTQKLDMSSDTAVIGKIAAARTIGQDIDGGGQDDGVDSGTPTLQYNLILETKVLTEKKTRASVSGHYGRETLDGVNEDGKIVKVDEKDYNTWSVIGSLYLPMTKILALQGTIWTGENLDTYFGGIGQGINAKEEKAISAKGGFIQLLIDPTDKWSCSLNASVDDPDDGDLSAGNRSKNELLMANAFYKLTTAVTLAAEYSHMKTSYKDRDAASNDRVQVAAIYRF